MHISAATVCSAARVTAVRELIAENTTDTKLTSQMSLKPLLCLICSSRSLTARETAAAPPPAGCTLAGWLLLLLAICGDWSGAD